MTPRPAISVLMPVLDPHPVFFPEAVASILGQTRADWELVIVEDPSESSAVELLRGFDDPRIRLITNPERTGLVAQRNRTLAEARGELVALLDADDVAEPERLAKQAAFLASHPDVSLVGSQLRIIDRTGAVVGYRKYPAEHADILRAMPRFNAVPQPGVMARKAALVDQGGYTFEWPAEDYDLWSRMLLAGQRFANLGEPLTRYRVHPQSGSKGTRLRTLLRLTRLVKERYWWGRMTRDDRLRYWGERALTWLPPGLVYRLFAILTYRRSPGGS
jgi:glycosyltransferase involved in cell wall biosynthesis